MRYARARSLPAFVVAFLLITKEAQFLLHRDEIERIASMTFDERTLAINGTVVGILSKHLRKSASQLPISEADGAQ
jgi:hypothetical protein